MTLYVSIMTAVSWFYNSRSLIGVDDANIYFVYMRNFAAGEGFVYNIGGEHVEGFTSLLWTLLGSVFLLLTSHAEVLLLLFNILFVSFSLWRVVLFIDASISTRAIITAPSLLFLGLLGVLPGFFDWTVLSLMETGFWSSLLVLTTLAILKIDESSKRFSWRFALLLVLMLLTRPEAMLWSSVFALCYAYKFQQKHLNVLQLLKTAVPYLALIVLSLGILTAWRLSYFGYILPNTYYAKISSDAFQNFIDGIHYLKSILLNYPTLILIMVVFIFWCWRRPIRQTLYQEKNIVVLTLVFSLSLMIPLLTGGDHFGLSRFIQPTLPLMYLGGILAFQYIKKPIKIKYVILILGLCLLNPWNNLARNVCTTSSPIKHEWSIAESGRERSQRLNTFFENAETFPSQGVLIAGSHAYAYQGETIDLLGLNNVDMAHAETFKDNTLAKNHASFNADVFFKQKPDIFWYGGTFTHAKDASAIEPRPIEVAVYKQIHMDARFRGTYKAVRIDKKDSEVSLKIMATKSFLNTLGSEFSVTPLNLKVDEALIENISAEKM